MHVCKSTFDMSLHAYFSINNFMIVNIVISIDIVLLFYEAKENMNQCTKGVYLQYVSKKRQHTTE